MKIFVQVKKLMKNEINIVYGNLLMVFVVSYQAVKTKTECGTGCQWKDPGTCAKEEKDVEEESDSDSSNYVKFLNYLLVLFLFIF